MEEPLAAVNNGNISQASAALTAKNNILYYLECGTLLRLDSHYALSNKSFAQAQNYLDAWVASFHNGTLGSVTDALQASLVNDKIVDYVPKDYEKVMLPTYKALNNFDLDDLNSSRIEITRMYNLEAVIQNYRHWEYAKAAADKKSNPDLSKNFMSLDKLEQENKNNYNFTAINNSQVLALANSYQNAFSHYLAGFIFQALGEDDLARPGYIKALQLNPDNPLISKSISDLDSGNQINTKMTDLLIVEEIGHAPQLKSVVIPLAFTTTNGQNTCVDAVTISFPELIIDADNGLSTLTIDGVKSNFTLLVNFNLMAARYLHDDLPNIFFRNLLRAAKDVTLQHGVCNNGGSLASLITTVGGMLLSTADDRTWTMLPSQILVSRVRLPRGEHTVKIMRNGISKDISLNLERAYQIFSFRLIGQQIYINTRSI